MNTERQDYAVRPEEGCLHKYAQHNEHCKKVWGLTAGVPERGEFQRDRERIVNSRAFRRMVDKAQIFTSSKGDHYRTRMTHTMEVAQIARSIANSLALNIDLTEAIALGHDLGHTPFGHQGERTLQDILNGRIEIGLPKSEDKNVYGGFKHNFQSVRMLNCLEEKYVEYEGLDVSCQVLEGVLKHTGFRQKACGSCELEKCPRSCCDLNMFLGEGNPEELYLEYEWPTTLEGQTVAVADEIAQRSHDVDDAMSAGLLNYEQLQAFLREKNMTPLMNITDRSIEAIEKSGRNFISRDQMICARVISDIVNYLVNDVIAESRHRIQGFEENGLYRNAHRFSQKLVDFTREGETICNLLESMVNRRVISSPEVAKFDYNASNIVKNLFQIYYQNPKLLHRGTLRKIGMEIRKATGQNIDLVDGDPQDINHMLELMTRRIDLSKREAWTESEEHYREMHIILVRSITDYIAGMTDSYARNEFASFS